MTDTHTIKTKEAKELVAEIVKELKAGKNVKVLHLGIFRVRELGAREGINPKTGERITIPPRKKVAFRPSKTLKDSVFGVQ